MEYLFMAICLFGILFILILIYYFYFEKQVDIIAKLDRIINNSIYSDEVNMCRSYRISISDYFFRTNLLFDTMNNKEQLGNQFMTSDYYDQQLIAIGKVIDEINIKEQNVLKFYRTNKFRKDIIDFQAQRRQIKHKLTMAINKTKRDIDAYLKKNNSTN
jgi:hypothetical protein